MTVRTADAGPIRTITLDRPEVRNAIDIPLRIALAEALEEADRDPAVRVIVITGAGRFFCSGGDIATMKRMPPTAATQRTELAQKVIRLIWTTPKPVIAAVEGGAFGAGTALAAACDRVVAASDSRFATTFLNVGLAGDMGIYASLPTRIGVARTRQMLLMGNTIGASEALTMGLVDALVDPDSALSSALDDARVLADRPAGAVAAVKQTLAVAPYTAPTDVLDLETVRQVQLFDSDDFGEGVAAFREKRPPRFNTRNGLTQGAST